MHELPRSCTASKQNASVTANSQQKYRN